ncbi:hypothetical protein KC315_g17384 [Hortaea werneckii]|nr:hypothetical protein KC315_g17384 [Hortaea werneckii]
MLASPDPRTGRIDLHNTWLTDIVKTYVSWAVKQGYAVIDVNLPKHITALDDDQGHEDADRVEHRTKEATELLSYLWENYIELNDATHVFLMGTNTGHGAIVNFIKANESRAQERLTKAISFVEDVPLQSCKSATSDTLDSWYYSSSMVFIANHHAFWLSDFARKIRKRFGRIFKSDEESISSMLLAHQDQITDMMLEETRDWQEEDPEDITTMVDGQDGQAQMDAEHAQRGIPLP